MPYKLMDISPWRGFPITSVFGKAALNFRLGRLLFFLREYFFPFGCALCGVPLIGINEAWYGLCKECHSGLEIEAQEYCEICSKPLISEHGSCLACRNGEGRPCDKIKAFFPYYGKYRRLLAAYKFGKNMALGNFFAGKILAIIASLNQGQETIIVPVPPRPGKIKEKGWDQVEYLTKLLGKEGKSVPGGIKICRCLKRLCSGAQKKLDRSGRIENLKNRIVPNRAYLRDALPKCVILIDDVITTGATLDVCASVLKSRGVEKVYGLCLFYD